MAAKRNLEVSECPLRSWAATWYICLYLLMLPGLSRACCDNSSQERRSSSVHAPRHHAKLSVCMSRGSDGWSLLVQRRDDLAPEPGTVSKNDQGLQLLLHDQASSVHKKCGCDCSSPAGTHTNHGAEAYPGFGKETLYHRLRSLRVKSFQQHNINLQCHQSAAQATPLQWAKNRT